MKVRAAFLAFPLQNMMEAGARQASLILMKTSHFDRNASVHFSVESMYVLWFEWSVSKSFDWTLLCYRSLASARRTVQEYLWRISVKSPGWWFCRRVTSFHKPQRQQWPLMNQKLTKQTSSKKRKRSLECQVCKPAILTDFCSTPKNGFAGFMSLEKISWVQEEKFVKHACLKNTYKIARFFSLIGTVE